MQYCSICQNLSTYDVQGYQGCDLLSHWLAAYNMLFMNIPEGWWLLPHVHSLYSWCHPSGPSTCSTYSLHTTPNTTCLGWLYLPWLSSTVLSPACLYYLPGENVSRQTEWECFSLCIIIRSMERMLLLLSQWFTMIPTMHSYTHHL